MCYHDQPTNNAYCAMDLPMPRLLQSRPSAHVLPSNRAAEMDSVEERRKVAVLKHFVAAADANPLGNAAANELYTDLDMNGPLQQQLEALATFIIYGCLDNKSSKFILGLISFMECRTTAQYSGEKSSHCLINTYDGLAKTLYAKFPVLKGVPLENLSDRIHGIVHYVLRCGSPVGLKLLYIVVKYLFGVCLFIDATQKTYICH